MNSKQDKFDVLAKKLRINWDKVDKKQFEMGMKVEQEHRNITKGDPVVTGKIVLAHLKEVPNYYTKLKKVEK